MRPCRSRALCVFLLASHILTLSANASLSVLLEEPYGWFSHVSPSGHTAVYLDHVCADTPVHLRQCHAGELGVVISRYHGIGDHDWIAVPLLGYLYAADSTVAIPGYATPAAVADLRERYRRTSLTLVAPTLANNTAPRGNWYELAGAAYDRTIYGFEISTTPAQDAFLIASLNDGENHETYNGVFRNCADFVRLTVDSIYPDAIRRNYIAGFGISSPKSIARSLSHYAKKHPELKLRTFRIRQVPGTLPRSHPAVTLMEGITKEFSFPLMFLCPIVPAITATAWITQGRFDEPEDVPDFNLLSPLSSAETAQQPQDSAHSTSP